MKTLLAGTAFALLASGCGGNADAGDGRSGERAERPVEGASGGPPAECLEVTGQPVTKIVMEDNDFVPQCLVLSEDQRIRVVNKDLVRHTLTVAEETAYHTPFLLDIDEIEGGKKATTEPVGTFLDAEEANPYFCKYHAGMEGDLWLAS